MTWSRIDRRVCPNCGQHIGALGLVIEWARANEGRYVLRRELAQEVAMDRRTIGEAIYYGQRRGVLRVLRRAQNSHLFRVILTGDTDAE